MTAPNTDPEKQAKRHSAPLVGFVLVLVFAALMGLLWAGGDDLTEDDAQDGTAQIEDTIDPDAAQPELDANPVLPEATPEASTDN